MGLPTQILDFFNLSNARISNNTHVPYSVLDFSKAHADANIMVVRAICQKLSNEGLLIHTGIQNNMPLGGDTYYNFGHSKALADYGAYDFLVEGFLSVRNHFLSTVGPVIIKDNNNIDDIGTCFVIDDNTVITAFHCIENMESIRIPDPNDNFVQAKQIWAPKDKRKDIAVIQLDGAPFPNIPHFKISDGNILDDILTMGYPPIPGFDSVQFAEVSKINTMIRSSVGNVVGEDKSYLDSQEYILINAKVKGGNSGGPIINKLGLVVGMLVHIPSDPHDAQKLDSLGYGVGIPSKEISNVLQQIHGNHDDIININFENLEKGFKTKL